MTKNNNITKKFTNTSNKKYIFFLFVANASCTIETNRTLNPVCKCFTINQVYGPDGRCFHAAWAVSKSAH